MNKPSYIGCDGSCGWQQHKKCWKMNHIPFAGYLMVKWRGNYAAQHIFERYVRIKKIVWPDEVRQFMELFKKKHPEIPLRSFYNCYGSVEYFGAYWHKNRVEHLFVGLGARQDSGILYGEPFTPKPSKRDGEFFKLATKQFINYTKHHR